MGGLPQLNPVTSNIYYEANILGNPGFPDGISFLIGNFHSMFGTNAGKELQLLADHYSWPLVWGLGAADSTHRSWAAAIRQYLQDHDNMTFPGNQRILDPEVLGSQALNASESSGASRLAFINMWSLVLSRRNDPSPIPPAQWLEWW